MTVKYILLIIITDRNGRIPINIGIQFTKVLHRELKKRILNIVINLISYIKYSYNIFYFV